MGYLHNMRKLTLPGNLASFSNLPILPIMPGFGGWHLLFFDESRSVPDTFSSPDEKPGDLPNFYVRIDTDHSRDEQVEDLKTVDDLVDWLMSEMQETKKK